MTKYLPPTTEDQRRVLYEDLEHLVFPGFITHTVWVSGIQWAIRSPCPRDWYLTAVRTEGSEDPNAWQKWMIASCTWMVDGQILLGEQNADFQVYSRTRDMHPEVLDILFSVLVGLISRYDRALDLIEPYMYEHSSRYRWKSFGRRVPSEYSGIPVSGLGLNHPQQIWVAYNLTEDDRYRRRRDWEHAKVVASTMSPKWVKKLDEGDRREDEEEIARRQSTMDRRYYECMGLLEKGDGVVLSERLKPKTVEDLSQEMRNALEGKKDAHDLRIEEYKAAIVRGVAAREGARLQRLEEVRRKAKEEGDSEAEFAASFVGYTAEAMQAEIANTRVNRGVNFAPIDTELLDRFVRPVQVGQVYKASDGSLRTISKNSPRG